ncbi:MAG: hypothetical protein GF329_13400 [Candidatus Lokiarchaeota archaeon]|nr:hypothetical protein [Candidatus Lokiarchaeota archaeon]
MIRKLYKRKGIRNLKDSEVINKLVYLGIEKSDAKIYLYLSRSGQQRLSTIAQQTGISRAKAYESLTRLIDNGFVFKELTEKQPRYDSISTDLFVKLLELESKERKNKINKLENIFNSLMLNEKRERKIHYNEDLERCKLDMEIFIDKSTDYIRGFFVIDDNLNPYFFKNIFPLKSLVEKSKEVPDIKLILNKNKLNESYVKKLTNNGIKTIFWPGTTKLHAFSLGIDGKYLLTGSYSVKDYKFNFINSLTFENESEYITLINYLFDFLYRNL